MDSKYKTTSKVENFFSMLLTKAAISDNLFIGNMPATVESNWKEMVLVDVLSMKDYGAYAKGSANVFLYAKSVDSNRSSLLARVACAMVRARAMISSGVSSCLVTM